MSQTSAPQLENLPEVICLTGQHAAATDEAEEILLPHAIGLRVFERSGRLVRIVQLREEKKSLGLKRPEGTVLIEAINAAMLSEYFERLMKFKAHCQTPTGEIGLKTIHVPSRVVNYYLNRTGTRRLPVLEGTALAPFLRPDGVVVDRPGYDEATGLYLLSSEQWLPVPDAPTKDDALCALAILHETFLEFPFVTPADRSVHFSALLTILQRRLIDHAPLIGYSAPMQRTGKSALAGSVAIVGTGSSPVCQTVSTEGEELRKMIFAVLSEGHAIVNLDNLKRPLDAESLSIAITEDRFSDRKLGVSSTPILGTRMMWSATANNLVLAGDMAVRALVCHIDAACEDPEARTFTIPDFPKHLKENRAKLVQAILIILKAYHYAGRPEQDMKPWAGFDQWCREIRAPLLWLGQADPCDTRASIADDDAGRSTALTLFHALATFHDPFTVAEAVKLSKDTLGGYGYLEEALKGVAERKGAIDKWVLGQWFRTWKGRFLDGMRLVDTGKKTDGSVQWKLEQPKHKEE